MRLRTATRHRQKATPDRRFEVVFHFLFLFRNVDQNSEVLCHSLDYRVAGNLIIENSIRSISVKVSQRPFFHPTHLGSRMEV